MTTTTATEVVLSLVPFFFLNHSSGLWISTSSIIRHCLLFGNNTDEGGTESSSGRRVTSTATINSQITGTDCRLDESLCHKTPAQQLLAASIYVIIPQCLPRG